VEVVAIIWAIWCTWDDIIYERKINYFFYTGYIQDVILAAVSGAAAA
jgi:hypothetical protein